MPLPPDPCPAVGTAYPRYRTVFAVLSTSADERLLPRGRIPRVTSRTWPGRRAVLIGTATAVAGLVAGLVTGCTTGSPPRPSPSPTPPSPDELAAGRAVRSARLLLTAESSSSTGTSPRLAALLDTLAATHREHLQALGLPEPGTPTSGATAGASSPGAPTPSSSAPPSGASSAAASGSPSATSVNLAALAQAERSAAQEALADVSITTPATAGLLARIAAARAVDADLIRSVAGLNPLGELTPPTRPSSGSAVPSTTAAPSGATTPPGATSTGTSPTPSESVTIDTTGAAALASLLAGEHAAVFAYGLVAARAPASRQRLARSLWLAHRQRRDELERRLAAAGRTPAAAEPAYDIGAVPTSPVRLAALATKVEDGLATAAFGAVTRSEGAVRDEAAADLVRAARRAALWRGSGTALPGTPS